MRFRDIVTLGLGALWQQKVRTILTTLGVVFGTFVLVTSLSINDGVQETIIREYSRHGELRRIRVFPGSRPASPTQEVKVEGNMDEARRRRLRQHLQNQSQTELSEEHFIRLTPDRLAALGKMEHVTAVDTVIDAPGRVEFRGKKQDVFTVGLRPDKKKLRDRLIAGAVFAAADERAALLSEFLLYQLGVRDDADLAAVIGQKIEITFGIDRGQPMQLLYLLNAGRQHIDAGDVDILAKIVKQLPDAVDRMELTDQEKKLARRLMRVGIEKPKPPATVTQEFTIAGVLRGREGSDPHDWSDSWTADADVVLPVKTAEAIYFRTEAHRQAGVNHAILEVDSWEHVKDLDKQIQSMGLQTRSLVEFLEREQLMYLLIFGAMTCVAAVALLVAGLSITNTMLISILERTREVGIMKAVGARDRHIQLIFLVEGALIGIVGGTLGLLLGWAGSFPADSWVRDMVKTRLQLNLSDSIFVFPLWLLLGAPLFACLVTTIAAVYPAWRAARVNPITALRHE
jgi:putative ABC transport system permease protein